MMGVMADKMRTEYLGREVVWETRGALDWQGLIDDLRAVRKRKKEEKRAGRSGRSRSRSKPGRSASRSK